MNTQKNAPDTANTRGTKVNNLKANYKLDPAIIPPTNGEMSEYLKQGWAVFPLVKHTKTPATKNGFKDATLDPKQLAKWGDYQNWGIATGNGLLVLDIDRKHGKDGGEVLASLQRDHGTLPATLTATTPSGGEHLYFSYPAGVAIQSRANIGKEHGEGLDIRADGGYIVAPPSHTEASADPKGKTATGNYQWSNAEEVAEIPTVWLELLRKKERVISPPEPHHYTPDNARMAELQDALAFIHAGDYDTWVSVGKALHSLGHAGFELWDTWSKNSDKYDAKEMPRKWQSFSSGATYEPAFIFSKAQEHGWQNPAKKTQRPTKPQPDTRNMENTTHALAGFQTETGIFTTKNDGVFYAGYGKDGQVLPERKICSYLAVTAASAGHDGNHGLLLEWQELRGHRTLKRQWAVPRKHMLGDGLEFLRELEDKGVVIQVGKEKKVLEYLRMAQPPRFVTSVDKTGWGGDDENPVFITPNGIYGEQANQFIYQPEHSTHNTQASLGTLEHWQQHVAQYAAGNSRLVFAIASALAGNLLYLASSAVDSGGFHLHGDSSIGKSITLAMAASVWGRGGKADNPKSHIRKWAATATAIEITAAVYNDMCLLLDELGECDEKQAAKIPYMLGNGAGKERANKHMSNRPMNTFRLMFLSNGEYTLEDHLKKKGIKTAVGQELRMLNIPADAGVKTDDENPTGGVIETLHGFKTSRELAAYLVNVTTEYYGTAGKAWLEYITRHSTQITEQLPNAIRQFKLDAVPTQASGQVHRAANRFALVAVAGELATQAGVTGWQAGEATQAAKRCFNDWLASFGTGNREEQYILDAVIGFIERNPAKFQDMNLVTPIPLIDRVGYHRPNKNSEGREYLIPSRQFERLAEGYNPKRVLEVLRKHGMVNEPTKDGKAAVNCRTPDMGQVKCYIIQPLHD